MARRRVYVGKTKKFVSRSVGPYQIAKRVSKTCYTVEDLPHNRRKRIYRRFNAHVSQLHPYRSRYEVDWKPEGEEEDSEECQGVDDVPAVGEDFCDDWEPPREADDPLEATPLSEESSQGSGPAQISPGGATISQVRTPKDPTHLEKRTRNRTRPSARSPEPEELSEDLNFRIMITINFCLFSLNFFIKSRRP